MHFLVHVALIIVTLNLCCHFGLGYRPSTLFYSLIYAHNFANLDNVIFIGFSHHLSYSPNRKLTSSICAV
jgi:hypothetical protein